MKKTIQLRIFQTIFGLLNLINILIIIYITLILYSEYKKSVDSPSEKDSIQYQFTFGIPYELFLIFQVIIGFYSLFKPNENIFFVSCIFITPTATLTYLLERIYGIYVTFSFNIIFQTLNIICITFLIRSLRQNTQTKSVNIEM